MKVCVVGLGSIGCRHVRNLREIVAGELQIDALRSGLGKSLSGEVEKGLTHIYRDAEQLPSDYDAVFVTNPTACHYETVRRLAGKTRAFFIEKPVFSDRRADIGALGLTPETLCYVAAPLRYHSVIQYLKQEIDFTKVYGMRCISSSYLPDWRPGTDYRASYSARKALGGGVAIDLIHEWDYITYLAGLPDAVERMLGKVSSLEIDSEDIALYLGRYPGKFVELHLDYFGRAPMRKMEIFMEEDTLECDLLAHCVRWSKSGKYLTLPQERDAFQQAELRYFLELLEGKQKNTNDLLHACQMMALAEG